MSRLRLTVASQYPDLVITMSARPAGLSKSKLLSFRQCPKRLYLEVHGQRLGVTVPEHALDPMLARHGDDVGQAARKLYGPGEMIGEAGDSLAHCLDQTQKALSDHAGVLFEATVNHQGLLIRADVLRRGDGGAEVIEVKSSTLNSYETNAIKQDILHFDCAVQHHTLLESGVPVSAMRLAMVDSGFVYGGNGQYQGLLKEVDVTATSKGLEREVRRSVKAARVTLAGELPDVATGDHCNKPFACPFSDHCSAPQSKYPSLRLLTLRNRRNTEVIAEVERNGWDDLRQVPRQLLSHERDIRIWTAVNTGRAILEAGAVSWAKKLPFPRYYIDFETIQFAVPIWAGTRPYEQIPFQWSCHVEHADGRLEHTAFLAEDGELPLRPFAESLIETLGRSNAPILVYSAAMEVTRLKEIAKRYEDLAEPIEKILARVHDLLPVMRDHYYHPGMDGSWSIKAVLPTIAPDMAYSTLGEVQDGGGAQWAFLQLIDPDTTNERRKSLREALLRYCGHDTLAMVRLAQHLK